MLKDIILKKLSIGDTNIDMNEFSRLTIEEKQEIESLISKEIYQKNSKFYKFIPYISNINLVYLMSSEHISSISNPDEQLMLITYCYIKNPKPDTFHYIVMKSKESLFGISMLEEILKFNPEDNELRTFVTAQKEKLQNNDIKKRNNGNVYYKMNNNLIVKINNNECALYVLDTKRKEWRYDSELYGEYAYGVVHMEPIEFEDIYPIGEPLDLNRGKVL